MEICRLLVMATTNDLDFVFIFILATFELGPNARERSDWQPSADWSSSDQTRERFWMAIIGFLAVAVLIAVKYLIYEDICKGIPDDENSRLVVTVYHLFVISVTLSCFAVRDVRDCHSPFPVICIVFCADACWLKANQSVGTDEMSLVCFVTKKGAH